MSERPVTSDTLRAEHPPQASVPDQPRRRSPVRRAIRLALVPAAAILLALLVGAVFIMLSSPLVRGFDPLLPLTAYSALVAGSVGSFNAIVNTLVQATPLVLTGLAVGIGFKAGLFNIGAQGQFLVGGLAAAAVGVSTGALPPIAAIPMAVGAAMLAGLAYGFIPGFLKAFTGAHEVVTTIMLNYVAVYIVAWAASGPLRGEDVGFARTDTITSAALPVLAGREGHIGLLFAAAAVPILAWLLFRSTLGFEIRTVGANPDAARYAGIRPVFIITLTMTLSGLLGGLAGAVQMLGVQGFYATGISAKVGFDAITVALLGRSSPLGIMFSALLFGVLRAGQNLMQLRTQNQVPIEVIDVIQALIILFLAADIIVRRVFRLRRAKGGMEGEVRTVTASWGEQVAR